MKQNSGWASGGPSRNTHLSVGVPRFLIHYHCDPSLDLSLWHWRTYNQNVISMKRDNSWKRRRAPSWGSNERLVCLQVPWPPRSMAESSKRRLRLEKWSSKTLRGPVRPTDQPAGRGDAHGPVFPTRGPCRSRARWVCGRRGWKRTCYVLFGNCGFRVVVKQSALHVFFPWNASLMSV